MATVYYPQFDLIRIDADGKRLMLASTTISVYNVTADSSLGTIASDANGVILQGSFTADVGDIIEYSHATYPGTGRHILQATQLEAYEAADNYMVALVLENLQAGEIASRVVDLYAVDTSDPTMEPQWVGRGIPGESVTFPYQTGIAKTLRIFAVSRDFANRQSEGAFFDNSNFVDLEVPATISELATEAVYGLSKLNYESAVVGEPTVVENNYPPMRAIRDSVYLESFADYDLEAAISFIGSDTARLIVTKEDQYTQTGSVITSGSLTVGEYYEVVEYPGVVTNVTVEFPGAGQSTGTGLSTTGGSGSGLTITFGSQQGGQVHELSVVNGGTGYRVGDIISINNGGSSAVKVMVRQVAGDNFSNVGLSLPYRGYTSFVKEGLTFKATGTTPTSWTLGTKLRRFLKVPANITVEFQGVGSLRAADPGGGIIIESLAHHGREQIFTSDGDGKILLAPHAVSELNVAWWAGKESSGDDTHAFMQARDSLAIHTAGGTLKIPSGGWRAQGIRFTDNVNVRGESHSFAGLTVQDGIDTPVPDIQGTVIYPADEDALYQGVFEIENAATQIHFSDFTLSVRRSNTLNAFRMKLWASGAYNVTFDRVEFAHEANSIPATKPPPLTIFDGDIYWHEFVYFTWNNCSWTTYDGRDAWYSRSPNNTMVINHPAVTCWNGNASGYATGNDRSNGFVMVSPGWVEVHSPEGRGGGADYEFEPEVVTTWEGADIVDDNLYLPVDSSFGAPRFTNDDIGRFISIGGTFDSYIVRLVSPFHAVTADVASGDVIDATLVISDPGDYPTRANAFFHISGTYNTVNIHNIIDEGFNYSLIQEGGNFTSAVNMYGGLAQGKFKFTTPGSKQFTAFGLRMLGNQLVNDGDAVIKLFGGGVETRLVRQDYTNYPTTLRTTVGKAFGKEGATGGAMFDTSMKQKDGENSWEPNQDFIIKTPMQIIDRSAAEPDRTRPMLDIRTRDNFEPLSQTLLRLGYNYEFSDMHRYGYRFQINRTTGYLNIFGEQAASNPIYSGINLNGTFTAERDIIAARGIRTPNATADGGIGYSTGAGGTVTQATSKSTGVTLNKMCGEITTHDESIAAGTSVAFTVTNSCFAATDNVIVNIRHSTGSVVFATAEKTGSGGSFVIRLHNLTAGAEAAVYYVSFSIIKAVTS